MPFYKVILKDRSLFLKYSKYKKKSMQCKPFIIDYIMYVYGLFSCNETHPSYQYLIQKKLSSRNTSKSTVLLLNFIIHVDPNKLLYLTSYPDAFFPSVAFNLFAPFLKHRHAKQARVIFLDVVALGGLLSVMIRLIK